MNDELFSRREKLVSRIAMGISVHDATADIASSEADPAKRERLYQATLRDWTRRNTWLHKVVRIYDETYLEERVASIERAVKFAYREYAAGDNSAARTGALRTAIMGNAKILELLLKTRALSVRGPNEKAVPPMQMPFEADPVIAEQYKRLVEKQMQEKLESKPLSHGISSEQKYVC